MDTPLLSVLCGTGREMGCVWGLVHLSQPRKGLGNVLHTDLLPLAVAFLVTCILYLEGRFFLDSVAASYLVSLPACFSWARLSPSCWCMCGVAGTLTFA